MAANIQFITSRPDHAKCIILPVMDGNAEPLRAHVSAKAYETMSDIIRDKGNGFDGKQGSIAAFSCVDEGDSLRWYILAGLEDTASRREIEESGGKVYARMMDLKLSEACICGADDNLRLTAFVNGFYLRSYSFTKYKTRDLDKLPKDITLYVCGDQTGNCERLFKSAKAVSDGVFMARDFVNEPPNTLYPASYVEMIKKAFKGTSVKITVLDERKLEKMGAEAILAVGRASQHKPRLVILEYDGRPKANRDDDKPLALVGKGVTYDTGGYSLKPRDSMETMKMDMGGSAAVVGAMKALHDNQVEKHVIGAVALAENMISGEGYRVDDVLVSLSGQTIEVINTDAEGRLCLADALTYVQRKYDPRAIVDAATLTGACMAALGLDMAGVFSNTKEMETFFWESGAETGDDFWPLPINKAFDKQIDSPVADMRNLGVKPYAGASTAAVFLQRFIDKDRPWAHLDIAGTAWRKEDAATGPKGATGFGVRAFYHWVVNG